MQEVEERGFDLLDLLGMVAENLKVLTLLPLMAGLIGLAVSYVLPKTYTSHAILYLPPAPPGAGPERVAATQAASIMLTPIVLDPVVAARNLGAGKPLQVARAELLGRARASVGKDFILRLDVTARTPEDAQATANAIVDAWFKSTYPGPRELERLTRRLSEVKASFELIRQQLARLAQNNGTERKSGGRDDFGASVIALTEVEMRYSEEMRNLEKAMGGLSRDVLVQEPTLPLEPTAPNKKLIAVGSALFGAFLSVLWMLFDGAWRRGATNPFLAQKQERIRRALHIGKNG